jgi:hypothetical protein
MDSQQHQCCTSSSTSLSSQLCSFNIDSNFEYIPIMKNGQVLLGSLDNTPNFILRTKLYPILDIELVLIRVTPELTILYDLLELLFNRVNDLSLFTLNGTFSTLGD